MARQMNSDIVIVVSMTQVLGMILLEYGGGGGEGDEISLYLRRRVAGLKDEKSFGGA